MKKITIEVPDDVFERMTRNASANGFTVEDNAQTWVRMLDAACTGDTVAIHGVLIILGDVSRQVLGSVAASTQPESPSVN